MQWQHRGKAAVLLIGGKKPSQGGGRAADFVQARVKPPGEPHRQEQPHRQPSPAPTDPPHLQLSPQLLPGHADQQADLQQARRQRILHGTARQSGRDTAILQRRRSSGPLRSSQSAALVGRGRSAASPGSESPPLPLPLGILIGFPSCRSWLWPIRAISGDLAGRVRAGPHRRSPAALRRWGISPTRCEGHALRTSSPPGESLEKPFFFSKGSLSQFPGGSDCTKRLRCLKLAPVPLRSGWSHGLVLW